MKASEIRPCDACGGPLNVIFCRVRVQRMGVDATALRQLAGLTMMLGSQRLAEAMGPVDHVAKPIEGIDEVELILCDTCACDRVMILALVEQRTAKLERAAVSG